MKNSIKNSFSFLVILLVTVFSCQQEESDLSQVNGTVRFGGMSLEFSPMGSSGSRISGVSPWIHIFPNSVEIVFTNKATSEEYVLEYNPNDFSTPYSILLPFGAYEFYSKVEAGVFSDFLPFEAKGEFILDSQTLEISLLGKTDYGLITVKNEFLDEATVSKGNDQAPLQLPDGGEYRYKYVKGGSTTTLKITESIQGTIFSKVINVMANTHYNFVLKLGEGTATIIDLDIDPFELEEEEIIIGSNAKFFDENGTIKCPQASPGDKGEVNGKVYEAVDRALLIIRRDEGASLSCVCTSLVSDMSEIFQNSQFNENISSWDVSNVTNMYGMFLKAFYFNQPIGIWDVSEVTNMSLMFSFAESFDQPIGDWDVSNVTNMNGLFYFAEEFNQPIGNWDVSNVKNMNRLFSDAYYFNQPIANWDVSKVEDMGDMFKYAEKFNQEIGDWDVSNVKNMSFMFYNAWRFNKPIGDWDVSNVTIMNAMLYEASSFNQNLNNWCVKNFEEEPGGFSIDSPLEPSNKPIWGTCPD